MERLHCAQAMLLMLLITSGFTRKTTRTLRSACGFSRLHHPDWEQGGTFGGIPGIEYWSLAKEGPRMPG